MTIFEKETSPDGLSVTMSAELDKIEQLAREVEGFLAEHGLTSQNFCILLGMREAMVNAVVHGSGADKTKQVFFAIRLVHGDELVMVIGDQGAGFDWRNAVLEAPEACKLHGRGLAIMKAYFDEVKFNHNGNSVVLTKHV